MSGGTGGDSARAELIHLDLEPGWRGGQRQVFWLIRGLAAAGYRQRLVCRRGSSFPARLQAAGLAAGPAGVEVREVAGRLSAWRALPSPRPGRIYHAHTGNTIPLAVWAARRGARSVVTRRLDLQPRPGPIRRADVVVAISGAVAASLLEGGVPVDRIRCIHSAVDLTRVLPVDARSRIRRRLGIDDAAPVGLTVAALVGEKDPLTLVRALAEPGLPEDYRHIWLGEGPMRPAVEALAEQLGVSGRLFLPGFDPEPDPWFAAADLFALPSLHEGLGTVFLDAFHFGLPVVGPAIRGVADVLEAGVTALQVPPGDVQGWSAALRRLLTETGLADALREAARDRVTAFGTDAMVAAYERLYEALAG